MSRLEEIKERVKKATKGPWESSENLGDHSVQGPDGPVAAVTYAYAEGPISLDECDAEFIAHARDDIPWLLEHLKEAREVIEFYAKSSEKYKDQWGYIQTEPSDNFWGDLGKKAREFMEKWK